MLLTNRPAASVRAFSSASLASECSDGNGTIESLLRGLGDLAQASGTERREDVIGAETRSGGENHCYFIGTRAFNSSIQLMTTLICDDGPVLVPGIVEVEGNSTTTNCFPSGVMSYCRPVPPNCTRSPIGSGVGLPKLNVGCVRISTATRRPALLIGASALKSA